MQYVILFDSQPCTVHPEVMCGRFSQTKSRKEVLEELAGIELPPLFLKRYNIAPSQRIAIIQQENPSRAVESIWGLDNPHSGSPIINARSESLAVRPMFKNLLATNRCLIPADGFYEWKGRQPYYFHMPNKQLFAFAGLWRHDRCVIITRSAYSTVRGIHERMPVILNSNHWNIWLGKDQSPPLLSAIEGSPLIHHPVSRYVNSVAHDDPKCLTPVPSQTDLSLFPNDD